MTYSDFNPQPVRDLFKMVLILTFGLILLVLASAGKLYADDHSKTLMQ